MYMEMIEKNTNQVQYAKLRERLLASLIDNIIVFIVILIPLGYLLTGATSALGVFLLTILAIILVSLYHTWFISEKTATPGAKLLDINYVSQTSYKNIHPRQALLQYLRSVMYAPVLSLIIILYTTILSPNIDLRTNKVYTEISGILYIIFFIFYILYLIRNVRLQRHSNLSQTEWDQKNGVLVIKN